MCHDFVHDMVVEGTVLSTSSHYDQTDTHLDNGAVRCHVNDGETEALTLSVRVGRARVSHHGQLVLLKVWI